MFKNVNTKRNILIFLFGAILTLIGISWKLTNGTAQRLPIKENWIKEATEFWLNGYVPCWYYRFRSTDDASASLDWIRSELYSKTSLQRGMEFTSAKLADAIKGKTPSITQSQLQEQLAHWSVPQFGIEYAIQNDAPFSVIIRSEINDKRTISHHFHFKVFELPKRDSQIEIWDYRIFH